MKIILPVRRVITAQFQEAFTALCRAKGLDVKLCFPLARMKRANEAAVRKFTEERDLSAESHGGRLIAGEFKFTDPAHQKAFTGEANKLLDAEIEHELPSKIHLEAGALPGDMVAELLELLDE